MNVSSDVVFVKQNTSHDTESLGFALLTSLAIMVGCSWVFHRLQRRFPHLYDASEPRDAMKLPLVSSGIFGWLRASLGFRLNDAMPVGMDQIMLLEFTHFGMKAMFGIGLPATMILAPLHSTATHATDDLLGQISLGDGAEAWILWAHVAFVWYVVLLVLYLVWHVQRSQFRQRRSCWLQSLQEPMSTSLLVEGIPEVGRTEESLAHFFHEIFGKPVVKAASFVRDTSSLEPLLEERNALSEELAEKACAPEHAEHAVEVEALEQRYNMAAREVEQLAEQIFSSPSYASDAAFVTFRDRRHAEFARRLKYSENPNVYAVSMAPAPWDVNFGSFSQETANLSKGKALLGRILVAAVFFGFLPVVIGISSMLSVDSLSQLLPGLKEWSMEYTYLTAAWEALWGTSLLSMLMDLVPWILQVVFRRFYRLRSGVKCQQKIQRWYFTFLVVFVLLVTAVGTSLFEAAARFAQAPLQVWRLLAIQLPHATNFYLRYAVLLWAAPFFDLLRGLPLLRFWRAVQAGEPVSTARQMAEPEDQAFHGSGARSARWSLHVVMGLTLCSLQPFVPVVLGFGFLCRRLVFGFLMVFVETKKSDSGGQLWRVQMQHTQLGLVIYIIVMTLILLERDESMVAAILAGSSGFFVALFWFWYPSLLELASLPVQQAEQATTLGRSCEEVEVEEVEVSTPYLQPELQQSLPVSLSMGSTVHWRDLDRALQRASEGALAASAARVSASAASLAPKLPSRSRRPLLSCLGLC
ncbi:unnamed protein product [Durusdinium trenchii]|uniref:CSC1/OSCA1-like 7TM region domain-containing protein n=1 Tax=Durusdinium trenchii TaxID=1381693 RepID=A0ABP0J108_9DINO